MKQLSLFISTDLERRAVDAIERAGVDGYLRLAGATGNKFEPADQHSRTMTWEALALIIPGADDAQVASIVGELEEHANACATRPCLRMVVSSVEAVY